jgi:hypothetical protein
MNKDLQKKVEVAQEIVTELNKRLDKTIENASSQKHSLDVDDLEKSIREATKGSLEDLDEILSSM